MIRRMIYSLFFAGALIGAPGQAYESTESTDALTVSEMDVSAIRSLTVLGFGRPMPLDSYARIMMVRISGRDYFEKPVAGKKRGDKVPAVNWLLQAMFDPNSVENHRVFQIDNPAIATALGIEPHDSRRYTHAELSGGIQALLEQYDAAVQKEDKDRSVFEKGVITVYGNLMQYMQITGTMSYADPHQDFGVEGVTAAKLGFGAEDTTLSALQVLSVITVLRDAFLEGHQKGSEQMSVYERRAFQLIAALHDRNRMLESMVLPFEVLPEMTQDGLQWLSPWEAVVRLNAPDSIRGELVTLRDVRAAYLDNNQAAFDQNVQELNSSIRARSGSQSISRHNALELSMNDIKPFGKARWLFGAAFILSLLGISRSKNSRILSMATGLLVLVAFGYVTYGIVARMLIMARPPVTNLYATFLFVAWLCTLLGFALCAFRKVNLGLLTASFSGLSMLLISMKFATEGDPMGVLVAVLDSNFWLSTHVVTIVMGYAGCCAAGVIGHVYLVQRLARQEEAAADTYKAVIGILAFGLIFSALGTMLGGIWADQSWGRFWGWDPKENGALLIVLWCAILFHARMGGMIRQIGMAAGAALGIIIVMLAWFGVNLLSTGLHSYGFTSGTAIWLGAYVVGQILLVAVMVLWLRRRAKGRPGKAQPAA